LTDYSWHLYNNKRDEWIAILIKDIAAIIVIVTIVTIVIIGIRREASVSIFLFDKPSLSCIFLLIK